MREVDVVLRDGSTVHVRPVRPEDEARYLAFLRALSEESRAMRYFVPTSETFLAEEARRDTHVDYGQRFGLVATTGVEERIVGHAIFACRDGERAEGAGAAAGAGQGRAPPPPAPPPVARPRAVAVIGASRERGTIGGELFHSLLAYGFNGPIYPVNPNAAVVQSVPAYPSVEAIPGPVDLAVIVVPAALVGSVAEQCGRKGVRALVVISAGFAEIGEEGRARQAELLRICRAAGMRLIGPNCMGIVNTDPGA